MSKFKIGDLVKRINVPNRGGWQGNTWVLPVGSVGVVHFIDSDDWISVVGTPSPMEERHDPQHFELTEVERAIEVPRCHGKARSNDPDTSKKAAKVKRVTLRERIMDLFASDPARRRNGQQIAEILGAKLNSVTPRFAELRSINAIEDSGHRLDGQILWQVTKVYRGD
jgi:hypothetical protein